MLLGAPIGECSPIPTRTFARLTRSDVDGAAKAGGWSFAKERFDECRSESGVAWSHVLLERKPLSILRTASQHRAGPVMTVRAGGHDHLGPNELLTGWTLVVATAVIAIVIIVTLVITKSAAAVTIVTVPLLIALGAFSIRRA
jgi:hypothetical protein